MSVDKAQIALYELFKAKDWTMEYELCRGYLQYLIANYLENPAAPSKEPELFLQAVLVIAPKADIFVAIAVLNRNTISATGSITLNGSLNAVKELFDTEVALGWTVIKLH